jgi:hypothetical protein
MCAREGAVRVTAQVLEVEAIISGLLTHAHGWSFWRVDGNKRQVHSPTFVACHVPSRQTLAVFVRPRRLYPSERPAVDWLPDPWVAVVWHPGLAKDIQAWLAYPVVDPPGAMNGTR